MAKYIIPIFSFLLLASSHINTTGITSEASTNGKSDSSVVFFGVLTTQEGHKYNLEGVKLNGLIRKIPVFEMPSETSSKMINATTRELLKNPAEHLGITKIDLNETAKIEVPEPDVVWFYRKETKNGQKKSPANDPRSKKYIQIRITDNKGKSDNYLIEYGKKIFGSEITNAGPKEKEIQLPAIKSLEIKCYKDKDDKSGTCKSPTGTIEEPKPQAQAKINKKFKTATGTSERNKKA